MTIIFFLSMKKLHHMFMLFRIGRKNKKCWWRHGHMTKLCLWADKQNDVSQSEDTLHPKLNCSRMWQFDWVLNSDDGKRPLPRFYGVGIAESFVFYCVFLYWSCSFIRFFFFFFAMAFRVCHQLSVSIFLWYLSPLL